MGLFESSGYIMVHGPVAQCEGGWGIPGSRRSVEPLFAALRNQSVSVRRHSPITIAGLSAHKPNGLSESFGENSNALDLR